MSDKTYTVVELYELRDALSGNKRVQELGRVEFADIIRRAKEEGPVPRVAVEQALREVMSDDEKVLRDNSPDGLRAPWERYLRAAQILAGAGL